MLHFLIATHIRCISMLPGINRFIAGRRIYAHDDITVVMAVKRSLSVDATETTIKVHFQPTDTIFDVYRKLNAKIEEIKTSEEDNNTEEVAEALTKVPRFLLRIAIGVLRALDYFGLIPDSLIEASPFHGSMIITDMGSLRLRPVFHHIYTSLSAPSATPMRSTATARSWTTSTSTASSSSTSASPTAITTASSSRPTAIFSSIPRSWKRRRPA